MTTIDEGYGARYSKIKTNKFRSLSPNQAEPRNQSSFKVEPQHEGADNQLGKIVANMGDRIDGIQIKIVSITNIVKLLQKYTETKDIQYEKQKENQEFKKNKSDRPILYQSQEVQNKINELQTAIHKAKVQITTMEGLRISMQREKTHKVISFPSPSQTINRTIQSPVENKNEVMGEIQDIMEKMESGLRLEMNKKIDICMNFFQSSTQGLSKSSSPSTVNTTMMQEQLHNMTLTMNKVEGDCHRNKMVMENKMEQIINYVHSIKRKQSLLITQGKQTNRSLSKSATKKTRNEIEDNKSEHSSISKSRKSKSKSQGKKVIPDRKSDESQKISSFTKIEDQKKQKQAELKQVLRKKKQNQQKLKMKK